MSYADYEHCNTCDAKVIYTGDDQLPDGAIVFCADCAAEVHELFAALHELFAALKNAATQWTTTDTLEVGGGYTDQESVARAWLEKDIVNYKRPSKLVRRTVQFGPWTEVTL